MQLRFEILPTRLLPREIQRGLLWLVLPAMFVPGIGLLVGLIVVGHNTFVGVVVGAWFLGVAGTMTWTIRRGAYEVVIDADEVRWRGLLATGMRLCATCGA